MYMDPRIYKRLISFVVRAHARETETFVVGFLSNLSSGSIPVGGTNLSSLGTDDYC